MLRRTRNFIRKIFLQLGLLSAELVIVLVLFLLSAVVFSWLVKYVFFDKGSWLDQNAFAWVASFTTPRNTRIMRWITFLGTHTFLIPANILLTSWFLFVRQHRWYSIKVAALALSSVAMMFVLKFIFSRTRPLTPLLGPALGYSFPSGHSMMSFSFYGLLIYLTYRYLRPPLKWVLIPVLACLIFLIGLSRIYLRVHYASDVIAGFSMGILWLVFSLWVLRQLEKYSKRNINPLNESAET